MLAGNFDVAVASEYADITAPGGNYDRRFARHADIDIGRNRVVAGALRIGVQGDHIVADADLRLGAGLNLSASSWLSALIRLCAAT